MTTLTLEQLRDLALWNSYQSMQMQIAYGAEVAAGQQRAKQLDAAEQALRAMAQQMAEHAVDAREPAAPEPEVRAVNDGSQAEGSTPE